MSFALTHLAGFGAKRAVAGGTQITWNPSDKDASITLSGGNMTATGSGAAFGSVRATEGKTSGKWYWEYLIGDAGGGNTSVGAANGSMSLSNYVGATSGSRGVIDGTGTSYVSGWTAGSAASTYNDGDVVGIALDMDNTRIFFAKNNTWQGSSDPVAGTNPWATALTGTVYPAVSFYTSPYNITLRSTSAAFSYSVPSGYTALSGF